MTSTPDDRSPEPTDGPGAAPVPEPPLPGPPGTAPAPPGPDAAAWGTTSSPVYGAGTRPVPPVAGDTQPLELDATRPLPTGPGTTSPLPDGLEDTRRLPAGVGGPPPPPSWTPPTPPAVVPSTPPRYDAPPAAAPPYGSPAAAAYAAPPAAAAPAAPPAAAPPHAAPPAGAAPYGTPPTGVPPYGAPPAAAPPYGAPPAGAPPYGAPPAGAAPYGTPPTGAPPYGAPPYGTTLPPYGGPGRPPGAPGGPTDGLAIASLVTSVGGLVLLAGLTGPIGIGLGIGSLARIRRTGAQGRGLAIAGIVTGAVGTALVVLLAWAAVALVQAVTAEVERVENSLVGPGLEELLEDGSGTTQPDPFGELLDELERQLEEQGSIEGQGTGEGADVFDVLPSYSLPQDLAVGTCWSTLPEQYDLSDARTVPCAELHDAEIVSVLTAALPQGTAVTDWAAVRTTAVDECTAQVDAIDPDLMLIGDVEVWLPHPVQLAAGDTVAYCVYATILGSDRSFALPAGVRS